MSISTASRPRDSAAATASNATAPGSAPARCAMTGTPSCSPQMRSCSIAAARNVSAAARASDRALAQQPVRELGDRRRLAGAVDADEQDHRREARRARTDPDPTRARRSRISVASARRASSPRAPAVGAEALAGGVDELERGRRARRPPRSAAPPPRPRSLRWPATPAPRIERSRAPSPDGAARRPMPRPRVRDAPRWPAAARSPRVPRAPARLRRRRNTRRRPRPARRPGEATARG